MNNDQRGHRTAMAIFAVILAAAMIAAFITTIEGVDTKQASNVAQPGTTGLAHPHPPLDRAPGEPVRI
jgi:type II secretory pathway component PulK